MRSKDQNKEDRKSLKYQVGLALRRYFKELDGNKATNVFEMVIKEVEKPMLEEVMKFCNGNKSQASKIFCLLYTSPSPRDATLSRMPSSA